LFDFEISLAVRFHWTPEQVGALDPDYVEELRAYLLADDHHHRAKEREAAKARADAAE